MTEYPYPRTSQTEPPATDDDLPITVPIRSVARAPETGEIRLMPHEQRADDGNAIDVSAQTPAVRIAGRLLSAAALAESALTTSQLVNLDHDTVEDLVPADAKPKLRVVRGRKVSVEYSIKAGPNYIGRRDDSPIEIDLEDQEPAERIWTSRKHAVIHFGDGLLEIEDLNSLNGTFVNRMRVAPGERRQLKVNDVVQVGTIQLRVVY